MPIGFDDLVNDVMNDWPATIQGPRARYVFCGPSRFYSSVRNGMENVNICSPDTNTDTSKPGD
jgi:hypothetical protein